MSKFENIMSKKPPHVFIKYNRGETPEKDGYAYGVTGSIPIAQLVGFIVRVQAELAFRNPDPCGDSLCVIAFDPQTRKMHWFVDSLIPVDALVGTLELIKCQLLDSQMAHIALAQQKQADTGLVASDGRPILKKGER